MAQPLPSSLGSGQPRGGQRSWKRWGDLGVSSLWAHQVAQTCDLLLARRPADYLGQIRRLGERAYGLINGGLSGISLNHSDIGGYTSLSKYNLGYKRESEQLKRWAEMSAFTALFRTHEGNQPGINAQVYTDKSAMQHFGRMSKVFKALASYRKTLFKDAESKGWPVVRHLALHYPGDAKAWTVDDQFLLGDQFLVAPIKNKCFTKPFCPYDKTLYLPKGEWTHLWSGKSYGSAFGSETVKIKAPIGEPAVFYPKGSAVGADLVSKLKAAGVMK
ncbi:MAG TPA: hypothetical protein DCQ06_07910 [Myxococcales bacterium]|nr:hypothetical protein [Myxococcales bacterium]